MQFLDIRALERVPFRLGIDQFNAGFRLGREHAAERSAIFHLDAPDAEVALDISAWVQNIDQQMFFGVDRHAGEVGADLFALAGMAMALGAVVLEDQFAGVGVAALLGDGDELIDHFLAIRIGQAAAAGEDCLGAIGDSAIGVSNERLALIEGQVGELHLAFFHGVEQGARGVGTAEQQPEAGGTNGGRQVFELHGNRGADGFRCTGG